MDASIVICTQNRASSLRRTLASLARMRTPETAQWEIIIVDNGSTDGTPSVVQEYVPRLPIRRVFEPNAGHSNARNKGVAEASGRYVIWTDDDVEVDEDWLAAYLEAFKRWPAAAVFGGKILPRLEEPVVAWFASSVNAGYLRTLLAYRDFGDEAIPLSIGANRLPFGANYAIRAAEQRLHLYDPRLGLAPNRRRVGEETDVICSIMSSGASGVWVPHARVNHIISHARQTEQYISDCYRGIGETSLVTSASNGRFAVRQAPIELWIAVGLRYVIYRATRLLRLPIWVPALVSYSLRAGELACWRQQGRSAQ